MKSIKNSKSKTIIYVINDGFFFLAQFKPLAVEAKKRGYKVILLCEENTQTKRMCEDLKIEFIQIPIFRASINPIIEIKLLVNLASIYKKIKPDIIHHITLKPILYGSLVSRIFSSKSKVINAVTGLGYAFTENNNLLLQKIIKIMLSCFIGYKNINFIFLNPNDLSIFQKLKIVKNNFVFIRGSGVDQESFSHVFPEKKEKLIITLTARMLKDKGINEYFSAAKNLLNSFEDKVEFKLYGKIDSENPASFTQAELNSFEIKNYFKWEGFTTNIKQVLIETDIYCLPSYREGLPTSIVEAMAIGRPIITTNAPGCDDTVIEGYNGFKIPVANVELLTQKLQLLIEDDDLRIEMGKNSRSFFEKEFTLGKVIEDTFNFYKKILLK